ncbi:hypothetical protein H7B90_23520 [Cohnella xylanilytica]|uniref:Uncharacterized protein n=1 Tax=Cohnella xylanilytica TaxID=557555 RepID=A0A841U8U6_9BACL|nr:hypothetical protein [Cohnella xylanilytica]MBB6694370.1 hypothetical protein [Cohnella xylanilytica]
MSVIEEAFVKRIEEVEEINHDYLVASGLQERYVNLYEAVMKLVPECAVKLLLELDSVMVNIELGIQARAYKLGLIDGMTLLGK